MLGKMGKGFSDQEIQRMVKSVDLDGNGMVSVVTQHNYIVMSEKHFSLILVHFKNSKDFHRRIRAVVKLKRLHSCVHKIFVVIVQYSVFYSSAFVTIKCESKSKAKQKHRTT